MLTVFKFQEFMKDGDGRGSEQGHVCKLSNQLYMYLVFIVHFG